MEVRIYDIWKKWKASKYSRGIDDGTIHNYRRIYLPEQEVALFDDLYGITINYPRYGVHEITLENFQKTHQKPKLFKSLELKGKDEAFLKEYLIRCKKYQLLVKNADIEQEKIRGMGTRLDSIFNAIMHDKTRRGNEFSSNEHRTGTT
jgi:hypothetical protein